jgi:hypothetical protein
LLLAENLAGFTAAWAGAEPLVKPSSGIRLKPFITAKALLEAMLVLHPKCLPASRPAYIFNGTSIAPFSVLK